LQSFANALQRWNTRPTWKNFKPALPSFGGQSLVLPIAFLLLLPLSMPATADLEAVACGGALAKPLHAPRTGLANRLQVLVWNIEKAMNPGWDTDLETLGASSDLLLIQEASVQATIAAALPQPLYQAFAAGYITDTMETGVLTLSAVEPSLHCNLTAWEPWLGSPKATNITEYPVDGLDRRLLVINLHAVNFAVGLDDFKAQVNALEPLLSNHIGPLIVAGDFNTWSSFRSNLLEEFMSKHQLTPVQFSPDKRTRIWDRPLDHVYLRDLSLVEASTINVDSSDHNPLIMTVEIPQCIDCTALSQEQSCTVC